MRDIRFSTFSALLVWMAVFALPALVLAQDNNSEGDAPAVFSYGVARTAAPPMTATVIGFTNANVGVQVAGFPCMGGALGCADQTPGTIALPAPLATVMMGSKVTYTFEFEDVSYTGPCSLSFVLMEGKTKLGSGHYIFPSGCQPNTVYFASFNRIQKGKKQMGIGALNGSLKAGKYKDVITQKFCIM